MTFGLTLGLTGEMFKAAVDEVRTHRLRSTVTMAAVAAAVFAVVVLGSLARSGTASLMRGGEDMGGARLLAVFEKPSERRQSGISGRAISADDAAAIAARVPRVRTVAGLTPLGQALARVGAGEPKVADVLATDAEFLSTFNMTLLAGRNLLPEDLRGRRPVAVLGYDLCSSLFSRCLDAIGRSIRVGAGVFRIVGVVKPVERFGVNMGFAWNGFALVPATIVDRPPSVLLLVTDGAVFHPEVSTNVRRLLAARHQFTDDFDLFDFGTVIEVLRAVFRILEWLLALLTGIALVVAAFGIFQAQMASFRQRTLASGIRLALGAPRSWLALQMLFEASLIGLVGAATGALAGVTGSALGGRLIAVWRPGWIAATAFDLAGVAVVAAIVIGACAGLVPAIRTMRLSVIECLVTQ
jgi:putative ABC transport system permease protein